jgi:hypothetical protein
MKRSLSNTAGDTLLHLEQFVIQASIYWELHWTLICRDSFLRHKDVFNRWLFWYAAIRESSLIAAIAEISKFLEKNNSSVNVHYFIHLLTSEKDDWTKEITEMKKLLAACEKTSKDITVIRSNYFLHKSRKLTFAQTFGKTSSKYDSIRELIEQMRRCLSVVTKAVSEQEVITEAASQKAVAELEEILNRLKSS